MTTTAVVFLIGSWAFVLGLMIWCFARILRHQRHLDSDGRPARPPERARTDPP